MTPSLTKRYLVGIYIGKDMRNKGLILLSGGLDSMLACKLLQEQGISLEALHFSTPFTKDLYWPQKASELLGLSTKFVKFEAEYIEIIRNPEHGYGSNLNPCIDCRIMMLEYAKDYMNEIEASFIVTGEVVGERPMTQNRNTIRMIEKCAGLDGLIVRPLTAKLLPPSIPEQKGIVDRERLLGLNGRSRKPQLKLAKKYGLKDFPTPAGGCLLTDPSFSRRVRDLMEHKELNLDNIKLLFYGRHFRLPSGAKVIVGRNQRENQELLGLSLPGDYIFQVRNKKGPTVILKSENPEDFRAAAALSVKYAKSNGPMDVLYRKKSEDSYKSLLVSSNRGEFYSKHLI